MTKFFDYINEGFADNKNFTSDMEILRSTIAAELDAINFYEQLSKKSKDRRVIKLLLDIANEEKVHFGEFKEVLELLDPKYEEAEKEAEEEVEDMSLLKFKANEGKHILKIYSNELNALDDAFNALSKIGKVEDPTIRKEIVSLKINIKHIIGQLRNI